MDDATHEELKAWLEFYQELSIEGFYRREPLESGISNPESPTAASRPRTIPSTAPAALATDRGATNGQSTAPPMPKQPAPTRVPVAADTGLRTPDSGRVIRPPAPSFSLFEAAPTPRSGPETLEQVRQDLGDCRRCKLAPTRKTIVFGEGNPHAELVFIGEGPGADEDEQGLPFVGRAGKLLNRMMQTVGLKREDVY